MLAAILINLNMVGGGPMPPTPDHGGGEGGHFRDEIKEVELMRLKRAIKEEEFIIILSSWLAEKNNN